MRLPNPFEVIIDLFTAHNWDQVGATTALKRMCIAWGVVLLLLWMAWNVAIVLAAD